MIEPRYILAICVLAVWIVVRLVLMRRRNVLMQRRLEREAFEARESEQNVPSPDEIPHDKN